MPTEDGSLINKVANKLSEPPPSAEHGLQGSILTVAAASYGSRPNADEQTQPTGFDPQAAALFEAVVESAFLVASADGDFDESEQSAFRHVVISACGGAVMEQQLTALLADLEDQLQEDGLDRRVLMLGRTINKPEHAREVLRVAALLAQVSGGVSDSERQVLEKLRASFGLNGDAVDRTLEEVKKALTG
ncbi:MAG TPA: tellurite resistance TerB family protein [Polyangiaceae bacterium]|jgi:tellurite resistance protein